MNTNLSHPAKRAFTLIEVLIVIAIIAILAAFTSKMSDSVSQSQDRAKATTDIAAMATALETFKGMYNDYPRINAKSNGVASMREFYKCIIGKTFMKLNGDQISLVDIQGARDYKPLLDVAILRIGDPKKPDDTTVNYDSPNVCILDPWGNTYMYYYDPSLVAGSIGQWESSAFILMSKGMDGIDTEVNSMYSSGILPDESDYRDAKGNVDNIVFGWDN